MLSCVIPDVVTEPNRQARLRTHCAESTICRVGRSSFTSACRSDMTRWSLFPQQYISACSAPPTDSAHGGIHRFLQSTRKGDRIPGTTAKQLLWCNQHIHDTRCHASSGCYLSEGCTAGKRVVQGPTSGAPLSTCTGSTSERHHLVRDRPLTWPLLSLTRSGHRRGATTI